MKYEKTKLKVISPLFLVWDTDKLRKKALARNKRVKMGFAVLGVVWVVVTLLVFLVQGTTP